LTLAVAGAGVLCMMAWAAAHPRRKGLTAALEVPSKEP